MQTVKPKERNGSERNGGIRTGYERKCEVRRKRGPAMARAESWSGWRRRRKEEEMEEESDE